MFCKYCGKEIEDGKEVCGECMQKQTETKEEVVNESKTEAFVGSPVIEEKTNNTNTNTNTTASTTAEPKSKIAAGLFGIFLGAFGVHNFYLGFTGKAVAQLLITILSCGCLSVVSGIWGLIEGILILAGEISTDAYGTKLKE